MAKNTLTDEQEWQDRIEQQEHEDCNQDHSSTGMCPCCGDALEEYEEEIWTGRFMNVLVVEKQQTCPSCEWTSVYFVDN